MQEKLVSRMDFEQNIYTETERKFVPLFPESFTQFRPDALPIEQFYLSHPSEDFSLRFREAVQKDGTLQYLATLKDRGSVTDAGLARLEVETEVSPELYQYYHSDVPTVRKLRARVQDVEIDFFENGDIHLEAEDPAALVLFTNTYGDTFVDMSGSRTVDNEWRAHLNYRCEHGGKEAFAPLPELDSDTIVRDVLGRHTPGSPTFLKICGRSGSGKSTIVRGVQEALDSLGLTSNVISTDDYHRGITWLENYNGGQPWTDWDGEIVYDLAEMARDLDRLQNGETVSRRTIDWATVEPVISGQIQPAAVVILEGIYAGHTGFDTFDALSYTMPTPLATCIGRRLLRDLRERPQFADPKASLKYMLEQAEPAWRSQQK